MPLGSLCTREGLGISSWKRLQREREGERPLLDLVAWVPRMLLGGAGLRQKLGWGGEQGLAGDKAWPWA